MKKNPLLFIAAAVWLAVISFPATAIAQWSLSGGTCVAPGVSIGPYTISGAWSTKDKWTVSGGIINQNGGTSMNNNGTPSISITWNGAGTGTLSYYSPATAPSPVATLTVNIASIPNPTPSSVPVPNGYPSSTTFTSTGAMGPCGPFSYQWLTGPPGQSATAISGATGLSYTATGSFTTTTFFYIAANSPNMTGTVTSGSSVLAVVPSFTPGVVSPSSASINYNTSPGTLTATASSGTGTCNGSFSYQWQSSVDGTNWTNISGATGLSYTPGNLTTTTYYRQAIGCTPVSEYTNFCKVTVYPLLVAGTVSPSTQQINYNTAPGTLTGSAPSGGSGSYNYQWDYWNGTTWVQIAGANSISYTPGALTQSTTYMLVYGSNGANANSNSVTVNVYPPLAPGAISPSSQTINYNTVPSTMTVSGASGGNGSYTYQWYTNASGTWQLMGGVIQASYTPGALSATASYYVAVTSNGVTVNTATITITVYPPLSPGNINPASQLIDYNSNASQLTLSGVTGGNGTQTWQWQSSPDNVIWTNLGIFQAIYTPTSLTSTTYYRCAVSSNGVTVYTSGVVVTVQTSPINQTQPGGPTGSLNPTPGAYSVGIPLNYVRTWDAQMPVAVDTTLLTPGMTVQQVQQSTNYVDGLGRLWQTVVKGISPAGYDMVSPHVYDAYGRETFVYDPYVSPGSDGNFKMNPFAEQSAFMTGMYPGEQAFYSQTNFEPSPLNRILNAYSSGNSWVGSGNGVGTQYLINEVGDSVQQWGMFYSQGLQISVAPSGGNQVVTYTPAGLPGGATVLYLYETPGAQSWTTGTVNGGQITQITISAGTYNYALQVYTSGTNYYIYPSLTSTQCFGITGMYAAGSLYKTVTTDENGNQTIVYTDQRGLILLKKVQSGMVTPGAAYTNWLSTYYIYDDDNNLCVVIPPASTQALRAANWVLPNNGIMGAAFGPGYCYQYVFDGRKRAVSKNIPGMGTQLMVYDARDRLVLSQDSVQRGRGEWRWTNYDSLNRPIVAGMWENASSQSYHQALASTSVAYPLPSSNDTVLTQTYYDDYSWVASSGSGLSGTLITPPGSNFLTASDVTFPYPRSITANYQTRGKVTGTKVNVLNTTNYLYNVHFFDDRERLLQIEKTNYSGGVDTITTQYGFLGWQLITLKGHGKGGVNHLAYSSLKTKTYDASGRVLSETEKIGNSLTATIHSSSYDELGRLSLKKLGRQRTSLTNYAYTGNPLDTLRYNYNIRSWVNGINKAYANNTGGAVNWFGLELDYDYGFSTRQLNGNIAGTRWRDAMDGVQRAYGFTYDPANRLTRADFNQYTGGSWNNSSGIDFSVHNISYDPNGNILTLNQVGVKLNKAVTIDSLIYGYVPNTNQLNYVTDLANDTSAHLGDFTEIHNNTSQDYTYDGNGNLTMDNNKAIATIHYNSLNMPDSIVFTGKGYIKYVYDAEGTRQQKVVIDNMVNKKTTTTYVDGFVYQSTGLPSGGSVADTLQYVIQDEGKARPKNVGVADTLFNDFFEHDHLGNTRVVLTDQPEQDVYPAATIEHNSSSFTLQQAYYTISTADTVNVNKIASWGTTTGNNYANNNGNPPYNTDPYINTTATSSYVYHLNGQTGDKTGLGITLRVMSGDVVNIYGKSFWHNNTGSNPNNSFLISQALNTFIGLFAGTSAVAHANEASAANLEASTATTTNLNNWVNNVPNPSQSTVPKAYINWILFNDQFVPIASNCGYDLVNTSPDAVKSHSDVVNVGTSGYLYVYCSNESNVDVYFDNLQVVQTRGPLLETNNYYPFGLGMAAISDMALRSNYLENKYRYNKGSELQNKEFSDQSGLEWYETHYRMLDPQIGRWNQIDPKCEEAIKPEAIDNENSEDEADVGSPEAVSPYASMGNDPIRHYDPNGDLFGIDNLIGAAVGALVEIGTQVVGNAISGNKLTDIKWGKVGVAAAEGFVSDGVSNIAKVAVKVGGAIINSAIDNHGKGLKEIAKGAAEDLVTDKIAGTAGKLGGKLINKVAGKEIKAMANSMVGSQKQMVKHIMANTTLTKKTATTVAKGVKQVEKKAAQMVVKAPEKASEEAAKALAEKAQERFLNKGKPGDDGNQSN